MDEWSFERNIEVCLQRFETRRTRCDKFQIRENVVHAFLNIVWSLQQSWRFLRHSEYRQTKSKIISNHVTNHH